jgi:DNA-binding MarR family transcriptional regulator
MTEAAGLAANLEAIGRILGRSRWAEARRLPTPLTPPQVLAMRVLVEHARDEPDAPGLSLSELSEQMGLAHSTASGIVDRLERRGLVERAARSEDRRYIRIDITKQVRRWLEHDLPALGLAPLAAALALATDEERTAVTAGVAVLERLLRAVTAAGPSSAAKR